MIKKIIISILLCTISTATFTTHIIDALKLAHTLPLATPAHESHGTSDGSGVSRAELLEREQRRIRREHEHQQALSNTEQEHWSGARQIAKDRTREAKELHQSFLEGKRKAVQDAKRRVAAETIQKNWRTHQKHQAITKQQQKLAQLKAEKKATSNDYLREKEQEMAILKRQYYTQLAEWEAQHSHLTQQQSAKEEQLNTALHYSRTAFQLKQQNAEPIQIIANIVRALEILAQEIENPWVGQPYIIIKETLIGINNSELRIQLDTMYKLLIQMKKADPQEIIIMKEKLSPVKLATAIKRAGYYPYDSKKWEYLLPQ